MLYIKNGKIIDPEDDRVYFGDLEIKEGKIVKIICRDEGATEDGYTCALEEGNACVLEEGAQVIDAKGMMIAPGFADVHVHFRDPGFTYKEDIYTGAAAAAAGGYTEIVLMANTKPCVDNEETLNYVLNKGKETGIHIESCVNVTKGMAGKELVDMEGLAEKGAVGFTDDGIPIMDVEIVKEAMMRAAALGKPISFHEENPALISNNGVNAGKASAFYEIGGSPREAEISLVERDLKLAMESGADVVIQHISSKEAVELVRRAKAAGAHVHAEGTPHHFTLTEDAVIKKGTLAKMNPPLREEGDRLAVIEGLRDGTIDMIATDHAPHSAEEKGRGFEKSLNGIVGLETAFPALYTELVKNHVITLEKLLGLMSYAPQKRFGIELDGFTVYDLENEYTIDPSSFCSKGRSTPFDGKKVFGKCIATVSNGNIAYLDEKILTV